MQDRQVYNTNIVEIRPIATPREMIEQIPLSARAKEVVLRGRREIQEILSGQDERLLLIVGPCSIHDPDASYEYAQRLQRVADDVSDRILLVLRAYFEKPRTNVGWKGLIHDPRLDDTFDMQTGFQTARDFLLRVVELGLPAATEFVDTITPQYIADLVSWAAIGARTAESQPHRQMASGLSMPIGFKNGTGGSIKLAVDGLVAAKARHGFLSVDENGKVAQVVTTGNPWCHIVLRGSEERGPNYGAESVARAVDLLAKAKVNTRLMIDCSHGNSNKDHNKQPVVFRDVLGQRLAGNANVMGVMVESHLNPGRQAFTVGDDPSLLKYGVSITDACIGWEETESLLAMAYDSLGARSLQGAAAGNS